MCLLVPGSGNPVILIVNLLGFLVKERKPANLGTKRVPPIASTLDRLHAVHPTLLKPHTLEVFGFRVGLRVLDVQSKV